jgi:hypothetical protein
MGCADTARDPVIGQGSDHDHLSSPTKGVAPAMTGLPRTSGPGSPAVCPTAGWEFPGLRPTTRRA